MADLFISYAREDSDRAKLIANSLEAEGFSVFWDNEIPAGQTWADFIEAKLTNSAAVLVVWTETSTKSQWVREEARMGRDAGKLIPVQLDGAMPPFGFGEVQAANLSGWAGDRASADWQRLVAAIRYALDKAGTPAPTPRAPAAAAAAPAAPRAFTPAGFSDSVPQQAAAKAKVSPLALIGGAAVVLGGLIAIGVMNRPPAPVGVPAPMPGVAVSQARPSGSNTPAQSLAAAALAPAVQAVVTQALSNEQQAMAAAQAAQQLAQQGMQAASAAQANRQGYGVTQLANGATAMGDLGSIAAGQPGLIGMSTPQGLNFSGSYQEGGGGTTMNGAVLWGAASAAGRWQYASTGFAYVGVAAIDGRYQWATLEQGTATGSQGVGAVTYPDGRRYLGEYRTAGNGPQQQLFMHGTGALYAANGDLIQAGSFQNDRYVGPG